MSSDSIEFIDDILLIWQAGYNDAYYQVKARDILTEDIYNGAKLYKGATDTSNQPVHREILTEDIYSGPRKYRKPSYYARSYRNS